MVWSKRNSWSAAKVTPNMTRATGRGGAACRSGAGVSGSPPACTRQGAPGRVFKEPCGWRGLRYAENCGKRLVPPALIRRDTYCHPNISIQIGPKQLDSTASRLLSEVKQVRAQLVLGWVTTVESWVSHLFFARIGAAAVSIFFIPIPPPPSRQTPRNRLFLHRTSVRGRCSEHSSI